MSYHFKCLNARSAGDVHARVFLRKFCTYAQISQISQISKESIFQESRISTCYHVVAPVKLWHGHTSCGARYKTKTMLQVWHLIGSFCALRTSYFDINKNKKCMKVFYHIATNYWCCVFPCRSGFQENVEWKDNHVIDLMPASEIGLFICQGNLSVRPLPPNSMLFIVMKSSLPAYNIVGGKGGSLF